MRTAAAASLAAAGLVAATLAATTTSAGATGSSTIRVPLRVCKTATAGHRACDALRMVTKKVTPANAKKLESQGLAKATGAPRVGTGPEGGFSPAGLAKAYGINENAKTKKTVAIVDAFDDPSVRSDLNAFDKHYGFHKETTKSFKVIGQDGGAPPATSDEGWAGEITLDVQSVRAICRHCKILLVEANDNNDNNLANAVKEAIKKGATIVSNSYGGPESPADPKWIQKAYSHKHTAILASSGDDGWYDWDNVNSLVASSGMSQSPASYPHVVGVGGTTLYTSQAGKRTSEQAWNRNGPADFLGSASEYTYGYEPGAAGSGCSAKYNAPKWQKSVKGYKSLGCGSKRSEVDIAALADPFTGFDIYETFDWCTNPDTSVCPYTSADDGWSTYGGTSLASPVTAAMWGLAGGPSKHVAYPAQTLYANYKKHKSDTYDVTVGGTGGCFDQSPKACGTFLQDIVYGPPTTHYAENPNTGPGGLLDCAWGKTGNKPKTNRGQCYAQPGYDGVSGVGSPKGLKVFK
jgi:hypothetical protein